MPTKGNIIKQLRIEKKITQTELAEMINVSKQNMYKYENDIITNIPSDKIELMAKAFNVAPSVLMGWDDDISMYNILPIKKIKLPILGKIACGKPIYAEQEHDLYIETDDSYGADFCLRAQGESMINASIGDGDIVLLKEASIVNNGEIAAVVVEDEATLKRVYYDKPNNKLVLQSENPKYSPLVYTDEELNTIRIIGKAVAVIKRL